VSRLRWTAAAVLASALAAAACDSAEEVPETKSWQECQAGDRALVTRAFSAVTGRLPHGQAEINVYQDVVQQLRKKGMDEKSVRGELVRALSRDDAYVLHWADFFLDALHMRRRVTSSYFGSLNADCFGPVGVPESADLAEYVRDSSPLDSNPSFVNFTVGRLLTSSLLLDDLSPYYRAGLFQLMTAALPGNNVDPLTLEWTRRKVLGETFHETYLNRNITCLKCHNSEFSITADADPALNRAWPIAGYFERALYGDSEAPGDPMQFHSVFRGVGRANFARPSTSRAATTRSDTRSRSARSNRRLNDHYSASAPASGTWNTRCGEASTRSHKQARSPRTPPTPC
jgi:hypothetical protein